MNNLALVNNEPLEEWMYAEVRKNAPYAPYCSNVKRCDQKLPRLQAFEYKYIQLNPPCNIKWFVIDVDECVSAIDFTELPKPNVIVKNKDNDKGHLLYRVDDILIKSVKGVEVKKSPITYAKSVYYGMCKAIPGADKAAFNNKITKNPLHVDYETTVIHNNKYTLKELANAITPDWSVYKKKLKVISNPNSRHITLFDNVRYQAYADVERYRVNDDINGFAKHVYELCEEANSFVDKGFKDDSNLPESSLRAVAKSIATWTYNNYTGESVNRGVMCLPDDMDLKEKQALAAKRSSKVRKEQTINTLTKALSKVDKSLPVSKQKQELAQVAKVSISSVRRYWDGVTSNENTSISTTKKSVGVNKVSFVDFRSNSQTDVKSSNQFQYKVSRFGLDKELISLADQVKAEYCFFTSNYLVNSSNTRIVEKSTLNVQTLKKGTRERMFRGWYQLDLTLSHLQMLNLILDETGVKSPVIEDFIKHRDQYFEEWFKSGISKHDIKKSIHALLHGGSPHKHLIEPLLKNENYHIVTQEIMHIRAGHCNREASLNALMLKNEVKVMEKYLGSALLLHDGVLVESQTLAKRIVKELTAKGLVVTLNRL